MENHKYDEYHDIPVPLCFKYIYNVFIELYNNASAESGFTWQDMESYCAVRKIKLSQLEIDYIIKCKNWANSEINKLRKDYE